MRSHNAAVLNKNHMWPFSKPRTSEVDKAFNEAISGRRLSAPQQYAVVVALYQIFSGGPGDANYARAIDSLYRMRNPFATETGQAVIGMMVTDDAAFSTIKHLSLHLSAGIAKSLFTLKDILAFLKAKRKALETKAP